MNGETSSSSTSAEQARHLFDDQVVALAAAHPDARLEFSAACIDDSYYRSAFRPHLCLSDMQRGGGEGEILELRAYWQATTPALLDLVPGIQAMAATLARERRERLTEDADAPSTLIYQMW